MTDLITDIDSLFRRADEIARTAESLAERENEGDYPTSREFQDLDDERRWIGEEAIDLLHQAQAVLLAVAEFSELDRYVTGDVGPRLTCHEVDALASVLARAGHIDAAAAWIAGHGIEDETSDIDTDDLHAPIADAHDADPNTYGLGTAALHLMGREYALTLTV